MEWGSFYYVYNYSLTEYINLWSVSKLYYDEVK